MIRPLFRTSVQTHATDGGGVSLVQTKSSARFSTRRLSRAEHIAALGEALKLATRPELDHLAVELAELAIAPESIHPADLSPRAIAKRWFVPRRTAEAQDALDGLVACAHRLPARLQDLIVAISSQRLTGSLDRAISSGNSDAQRSAIGLIERYKLADASAALLPVFQAEAHPQLKRASHALLSLALGSAGKSSVPFVGRRTLENTLVEVAWGFEFHRSRQALLAAMLLIDDSPNPEPSQIRLRHLILEPDWSGHAAIRSALRNTPIAPLRGSAWRWLRLAPIATAALDRVTRAESIEEHESLLTFGHLALAPARARALRLVAKRNSPGANLGELFPPTALLKELSEPARLGRVRLVSVFKLGSVFTRSLLEDTTSDPSPRVRFAAVAAMGSGVPPEMIADVHALIARTATTAWSLAGVPSSIAPPTRPAARARLRAAATHRRSPHAGVRRIANEEFNRINPWVVSSPASRLSARRWLESDASAFLDVLRSRMLQPEQAVSTIVLARKLRVCAHIERDLIRLAQECADHWVVATAIVALGDLSSPASGQAVEHAMAHADARVRANALEARVHRTGPTLDLMQANDALHSKLIELKDAQAHRVRAGAVRALLDGGLPGEGSGSRYFEPKAADELERMLGDSRPMHRVSGLWVASRVLSGSGAVRLGPHWHTLADLVAGLATDSEPAVRRRATQCSARLLAEIRKNVPEGSIA